VGKKYLVISTGQRRKSCSRMKMLENIENFACARKQEMDGNRPA
jgi:hypothetical protein